MKILIVEDEIPAQEELIRILQKHFPDIEIAGVTESVRTTAEWLTSHSPDLIFMDIQLSDGSCFDIFRRMEIRTPVIFTTAYDQYALDAFKVNSIDYLLKPIDEDGLIAAVGKLNYRYDRIRDLVSAYFAPAGRYKSRISAKCGDTYKSLSMDDIAYFISEDGITFAVSNSGEKRIVDYTIESLEPLLDPKSFFRITRGCLASIGSIEKASRYFSGRLEIVLKDSTRLVLSRARVQDFLRWMDDK